MTLEDEGITFLRNVGNQAVSDTSGLLSREFFIHM